MTQGRPHTHKIFSTLFNYSNSLDVLPVKASNHVTAECINLANLFRFSGCLNIGQKTELSG